MITIDPPSSSSPEAPTQPKRPLVSKVALTRFLKRAQLLVGLRGEVSLLLTDDARMRQLNREFRGKRKTTDVLSFPAPEIPGLPPEHGHAGDLVISVDVAAAQAAAFGHTLDVEVRVLLLHGLLHLAGMDHEADAGEMRARELVLREELKLPGGLIERAGAGRRERRRPVASAVPMLREAAKRRQRP